MIRNTVMNKGLTFQTGGNPWRLPLVILGICILGLSVIYTSYLARQLKDQESRNAETLAMAWQTFNTLPPVEEGEDIDLTLIAHILEQNQHIPIILENDRGGIDFARNFGEQKDTDKAFLKRELESMKSAGVIPDTIMQPGFSLYLYYKRSNLLLLLTYFPLIQVILVSAFLGLAYFGFNSLRQAEQNRVWIGMAKETAHQLGTPISAIIAWIEYLKSIHPEDERTGEVIRELGKDVNRLELVADRFSKIGSEPVLQNTDLYEVLEQCRVYMQPRSPRKVEYDFPGLQKRALLVRMNPHLFHWVLENLIRNALDAMEGTGKITAMVYQEGRHVCIDLSDTGKGIPATKFRAIFRPGYSTKKRGWGLGLSLSKRIIESYHNGKIFVKKSGLNQGTTFSVRIPGVSDKKENV